MSNKQWPVMARVLVMLGARVVLCQMDPDGSTKFVCQVVPANIDADTSKHYRDGLYTIEVC